MYIIYIKESYLTLLAKHVFLPILKFQTTNHKFSVETERWFNIPHSEHNCQKCFNEFVI